MKGFHIHVDALELSKEFESYLIKELLFFRSDFAGHRDGAEAYEPPNHLTLKTRTSQEFRAAFRKVVGSARSGMNMKGYIEGEYVALDTEVAGGPFQPDIKPPFRVQTASLPSGTFRESEIHVVMSKEKSELQLLDSLLGMGLYSAYIKKSYGIAEVFTVQGTRRQIGEISPALKTYLESAGGTAHCSIKEERIAAWWASQPDLRLPPVIDSVEWL